MGAPQNQFLVNYKCYVCVCICACGVLFVQFLQKPDPVVATVDVLFDYSKFFVDFILILLQ